MNHKLDRPLSIRKNKKVIGLIEDELDKTYRYVIDEASEDEEAKGTKKFIIKRTFTFEDYKNCLEATHLEEKKEINVGSRKRNFREFIKSVKGIMFLLKKLIRLL